MKVLLLSMPDSFEHTPSITMRMPNGALASLAGNVDPHHHVAIADLVLAQHDVPGTVRRLVTDHAPDVVGLSIMTFQRRTAQKVIALVRALRPGVHVVVGGYDPSLAPEVYEDAAIRRRRDRPRRRATSRSASCCARSRAATDRCAVAGVSFRRGDGWVRNPARHVSHLDDEVRPPNRGARVLTGYTMLGRPIDIVETSRGCTYDCSFCSIIEMRGRNFHTWSIDRVIADIADARARGARAIFIVDDNITLNVARFRRLCEAIIAAGLNDIDYIVQGMTSAIVVGRRRARGARCGPPASATCSSASRTCSTRIWRSSRRRAKNAEREGGRTVGNATTHAVDILHRHGLFVVGGLIVGNPGDTRESIEANLAFARRYVDWPYIQHPTPYPGTPMTQDFREKNLIVNEDVDEYDGTTAVVRTEHLEAEEIEFMRWRAERWMKVRHLPVALRHDPGFVALNAGRHDAPHVPRLEPRARGSGSRTNARRSAATRPSAGASVSSSPRRRRAPREPRNRGTVAPWNRWNRDSALSSQSRHVDPEPTGRRA